MRLDDGILLGLAEVRRSRGITRKHPAGNRSRIVNGPASRGSPSITTISTTLLRDLPVRLQRAEPLRLDTERDVELRPEVLEGDGGGQLDDLRLAEVRAHPREQLVAHSPTGHG